MLWGLSPDSGTGGAETEGGMALVTAQTGRKVSLPGDRQQHRWRGAQVVRAKPCELHSPGWEPLATGSRSALCTQLQPDGDVRLSPMLSFTGQLRQRAWQSQSEVAVLSTMRSILRRGHDLPFNEITWFLCRERTSSHHERRKA